MNRRRFGAGPQSGALALTAGCLARNGGREPTDSTATDPSPSPDAATPTMDAPFPPNRDDVDEVVWHRQVSNPDDALVLEYSTATASLPDAEISFTLSNGTDRGFQTNFYSWALYRWEGGRWHYVAPRMVPEPLMSLPPDESHRWDVTVDNDDLSRTSFDVQGTDALALPALGGGSYAFAIDGWWQDQDATPTYEHQTVRAARFTLTGDPLDLEPSGAVTDATRDGDVVTVSATNEAAANTDEDRPATFVLARDESVDDPRHLIAEQVYREWPLRDALAHAEPDVATVRVETTTTSVPAFGALGDLSPIEYQGRTYRLGAEDSRE